MKKELGGWELAESRAGARCSWRRVADVRAGLVLRTIWGKVTTEGRDGPSCVQERLIDLLSPSGVW